MKRKEEMTRDERLLRNIIVGIRNDYIGGLENMILDNDDVDMKSLPTREEVIEYIYHEVMDGKEEVLYMPNDIVGIEKKHIHLMGEQFVRELIEDRVDFDIKKNGWSWL